MIFLGDLATVSGTKVKIGLVHYMPFDPKNGLEKTAEELSAIGILVDTIPEPKPPSGMIVTNTYVDTETKAVTYDYAAAPKTDSQRISDLETAIKNLQTAAAAQLGV